MRFASPPLLIRKYYSSLTWRIPVDDKKIFLTFDDGPIPEVTPFVLEQLKKFNCKATFFCIGENIEKHSDIFKTIIDDGHAVGNHTYNHLNGWKTKTANYIANIKKCQETIHQHTSNLLVPHFAGKPPCPAFRGETSNFKPLFRPPYGRITKSQIKQLQTSNLKPQTSIIMWDVLSYDFDKNVSPKKCFKNVISNIKPGSIIVFHDSIKAEKNLRYALPLMLKWILEKGFMPEIIQ